TTWVRTAGGQFLTFRTRMRISCEKCEKCEIATGTFCLTQTHCLPGRVSLAWRLPFPGARTECDPFARARARAGAMSLMTVPRADDAVGLANGVSREYLLYHRVCPRSITDDGALVVATAPDALVPEALDDLAIAYRRRVI